MGKGIFKRIKSLEIQGATNIARESLLHLKAFSRSIGFGIEFDRECKKLLATRTTAVPVFNVIEELRKDKSAEKIEELLKKIEESRHEISKNGIKIFRKKSTLMTHCHSSEAISLLKHSKSSIKIAFVTETRPMYQGIKTAKELSSAGIPVTLITDSAAGYFMPRVDFVVVGADAIRKEGIVNKVGTLPLAVVSKEFNKHFYVVASSLKFDRRKNFVIEMRPSEEIHTRMKNIRIDNPAFDVTDWRYITGVITETGIKTPKQIKRLLA